MPCDMRCASCRHCGVVASALRGCRVGTAGLQRQRCWADVAGVPRRRCGDAYFDREVDPRTHAAEQEERDARNDRKSDADVPVMTTVATYLSGLPPVPGADARGRAQSVPVQMRLTAPMAAKADPILVGLSVSAAMQCNAINTPHANVSLTLMGYRIAPAEYRCLSRRAGGRRLGCLALPGFRIGSDRTGTSCGIGRSRRR